MCYEAGWGGALRQTLHAYSMLLCRPRWKTHEVGSLVLGVIPPGIKWLRQRLGTSTQPQLEITLVRGCQKFWGALGSSRPRNAAAFVTQPFLGNLDICVSMYVYLYKMYFFIF